jgi:hypothetical protein
MKMKAILIASLTISILGTTSYFLRRPIVYLYAQNKVRLKYDGKIMSKPETIKYDVDTSFYAYFESRCISNHLILVGDIVDSSHKETFARTCRDPKGKYIAVAYSIKTPPNLQDMYGEYININEIQSETSDGKFVLTSTGDFIKPIEMPPEIDTVYMKYGSEFDSVHSVHISRISNRTNIRNILTLEEMEASENRQQNIKKAFRKGSGKISLKEIREVDKDYQRRHKEFE